ncbi:hypothetical protein KC331_g6274 [Hortaea werneckii]|uniref:Cell wall mannoprotein PIR1-like C-terminal domain-containing protein n=1 Tax=Hortaea werneckii TaxID=91943 RepID=A0A3M7D7D4_HORWE|nr:hypothetical protein KC331_g6274 [Hortaea werneckii]KAI7714656.1 hypothetical protein KC353_g6694 [Hortaea werneckii]RMY59806.1 hypothetical protein D0865_01862 [Hortaea werneckii]
MAHYLSLLALAAFAGASPVAQGVTDAVAPSATAPTACSTDYASRFGIAVMSAAANAAAPAATVSQIADGQVQAAQNSRVCYDVDSQGRTVSQIADGQIQAPTSTPAPSMTMMGVSQIADGQIQGPACTPSAQVQDGQMGCTRVPAISQIPDGQIQAPTATVQSTTTNTVTSTATAVVSQIADGQVQNSGALSNGRVACQDNSTLGLMLDNGVVTDNQGRTGYVASNRQFQFDSPPQAGAIYTSGFSLCSNGSLALGGSTTFYQCRSGGFYNLYDQNVAEYCEPVTLNAVDLLSC